MDDPRVHVRSELFDSRSVPAQARTTSWERVSTRFLVPLRIHTDAGAVSGVIGTRRVGQAGFCRLRATPHTGVRTARMATGAGAGHYKIALALQGPTLITQHGRRVLLRPGDLAVYDTSEAYSVGSELEFGLLIALVPHEAIGVSRDRVAAVAATRLTGPGARTVRSELSALSEGRAAPALLDQTLATIGALIGDTPPARAERHRAGDELVECAKEIIGHRLFDPGLDPDYVAAILGVSRRRLYTLFAERIGPVAAYIRTRRLEHAREMLSRRDAAGVSEVALECGFVDPAHFSRLFHRAYGAPPTRFRARAHG
ncbi:helix-turn-helix domain-containing protein [Nocardiopsis sp. JB363]|uniref:helix-turn-helix domain-containing protein n=1 Tax=Nocardiopsis sp. JB363 TaxID=1434837 RepID=UPI00097A1740|nr:helix-turn-helix domain-containing protein [Nocardiopsis sp. JB363]SIO90333.1 Transcriptional regulator, AraC family [Nocardiopsis sp. JB363]